MQIALLPFLAISILLIVIPGPDTAVVTKNALLGGRRGGVLTAAGVTGGLLVWTLAASLGIATLIRASEAAFVVVKLAGALYLVWLGVQLLRGRDELIRSSAQASELRARALRQGFLSDLGNPKIAVFFSSFLPQFVHGDAVFLPLLLLGSLFAVLTLVWLAAYALLVGSSTALINRPRVRTALDRFTGIVLIAFGVRLALERR
jgi:RhtB (resistance to homoserine/threonine) family protein